MIPIVKLFSSLILKNKPLYVHYGITHRCNLRCRMCDIYRDAKENEELDITQIEKVFEVLRRLGIVYVSIGGGEPFLRKDLLEVIQLLRRKGFMIRLLTNGTVFDEGLIKNLVSAGLKEFSLSLDTLDIQKQDYICNYENTWEKVIRSIDILSELLPKNDRLLLINTVVSPFNIKELPDMSQFAKRKGCYISFVPIENNVCPEFTFTQDHFQWIDESYNYLIKEKKRNKTPIFNSTLFLEKSREYLKSGIHNWQCDAGKLYFSVNPRGELSICHRFKPIALLTKDDFSSFLKSENFRSGRDISITNCSGCMRPCWAEISFLAHDKKSFLEMAKINLPSRIKALF